jgi:hypothetical protein
MCAHNAQQGAEVQKKQLRRQIVRSRELKHQILAESKETLDKVVRVCDSLDHEAVSLVSLPLSLSAVPQNLLGARQSAHKEFLT